MTTHLREPVEAELELSESSTWPERGKFLEAGPLLQTLQYLTDPLPADSVELESALWPEIGKFLQAVMETGPLLQTLLLTAPLPDFVKIPGISPSSSTSQSVGPLANALDTLQLNSTVAVTVPTAPPVITSLQSVSAATHCLTHSTLPLQPAVSKVCKEALNNDTLNQFSNG